MTREELIAALERADGPSRELDAEIAILIDGGSAADLAYVLTDIEGTLGPSPYTSSLDAALALVPESTVATRYGVTVSAYPSGKGEVRVWCQIRDDSAEGGWAIGVVPGNPGLPANIGATPAIALCLAALKARA